MAKTYIKLEQEDGSFLEFTKDRIKAHWVKETFKLEKKLAELGRKGDYDKALDLRINFIVGLFNKPGLTLEAIYEGVDSDKIITELDRIMSDILGRSGDSTPGES